MVGTDDGFLGLSGVKSLAGYLPMGDGRVVRFVLILNGGGVADSATFGPIWSTLHQRDGRLPRHAYRHRPGAEVRAAAVAGGGQCRLQCRRRDGFGYRSSLS